MTRAVFLALLVFAASGCDLFGEDDSLGVTNYEGPAIIGEFVQGVWSATIDGEEVTLRQNFPDRPEGTLSFRITLRNLDDGLPTLVDVWHGPQGGGIGIRIRKAAVEIESWDVEALVSGTIEGRLQHGSITKEAFRVELGESEHETGAR